MASDSTAVHAIAPGFSAWLAYPDALLQLGQMDVYSSEPRLGSQITGFIRQVLADVESMSDALVFAHAQNLRFEWPWLQNKLIVRDKIFFLKDEAPTAIAQRRGLRMVRVRTRAMVARRRSATARRTSGWASPRGFSAWVARAAFSVARQASRSQPST
jgi:hypothetical protein